MNARTVVFATLVATALFALVLVRGQTPPPLRPLIIAHRGGASEAPEETLMAYAHALAGGPVVLDGDVRLSADNVPVLFHDATLDRTTDGTGPVRAHTLAQLRALDAGYCFSPQWDPLVDHALECRQPSAGVSFPFRAHTPRVTIATVAELFAAVPAAQSITLEVKDDDPLAARALVHEIRRAHRVGSTCVGAFGDAIYRVLRAELRDGCVWAPASVYRCQLTAGPGRAAWEACGGDHVLQPDAHAIARPEVYVRRAHDAGSVVQVWTLDAVSEWRTWAAAGVDGIFTDAPARMRPLLHR